MIVTWIGDVRPLLEEGRYLTYWKQLPDFRREKADRYRFPMGRALSVGAWALWQQAREEFRLPEDAPFNLSHSGFYALCSAETDSHPGAHIQVGCDVEQMAGVREAVSRRFFCPEEHLHIKAQEDPVRQQELFFRYWVLKESFMKATRQGMAMALDSFSFLLEDDAPPILRTCPAPYRKEDYHFLEFGLASYRAAVCSTDPDISPRLRRAAFDTDEHENMPKSLTREHSSQGINGTFHCSRVSNGYAPDSLPCLSEGRFLCHAAACGSFIGCES